VYPWERGCVWRGRGFLVVTLKYVKCKGRKGGFKMDEKEGFHLTTCGKNWWYQHTSSVCILNLFSSVYLSFILPTLSFYLVSLSGRLQQCLGTTNQKQKGYCAHSQTILWDQVIIKQAFQVCLSQIVQSITICWVLQVCMIIWEFRWPFTLNKFSKSDAIEEPFLVPQRAF